MSKLLEAYEKDLGSAPPEMLKKVHPESGGRQVRRVAGIPVRKDLAEDLLNELKSTCWVSTLLSFDLLIKPPPAGQLREVCLRTLAQRTVSTERHRLI